MCARDSYIKHNITVNVRIQLFNKFVVEKQIIPGIYLLESSSKTSIPGTPSSLKKKWFDFYNNSNILISITSFGSESTKKWKKMDASRAAGPGQG